MGRLRSRWASTSQRTIHLPCPRRKRTRQPGHDVDSVRIPESRNPGIPESGIWIFRRSRGDVAHAVAVRSPPAPCIRPDVFREKPGRRNAVIRLQSAGQETHRSAPTPFCRRFGRRDGPPLQPTPSKEPLRATGELAHETPSVLRDGPVRSSWRETLSPQCACHGCPSLQSYSHRGGWH
jgi:hypothetical protein